MSVEQIADVSGSKCHFNFQLWSCTWFGPAEDGDLGGKDALCFTMLYFLPSILYIQQQVALAT